MERRSIALVLTAATLVLLLVSFGCQQTAPATAQPTPSRDFTPEEEEVVAVESVPLELETIYFDFDKATIRDDQRGKLQADAKAILAQGKLGTITLEGNCDERGSEEYNLALGERRAASVKKYLVDVGVPSSRLKTVSFGESKPAVAGHDESAWKWNRRVDFSVVR